MKAPLINDDGYQLLEDPIMPPNKKKKLVYVNCCEKSCYIDRVQLVWSSDHFRNPVAVVVQPACIVIGETDVSAAT